MMHMLVSYINCIDWLIDTTRKLTGKSTKPVHVGPFEIRLRKSTPEAYEAIFKKIAEAQESLSEGVAALDSLKSDYSAERDRLTKLMDDVKKKREECQTANQDLLLTQDILKEDRDRLKRILGIDDSRSKIIGFISGVLASLIAAGLCFAGSKLLVFLTTATPDAPVP